MHKVLILEDCFKNLSVDPHSVGADLGPYCLLRFSADDKSRY